EQRYAAAVRDRGGDRRRRGDPPRAPRARPAPAAAPARAAPAPRAVPGRARVAVRAGLPRDRDADPDQVHARGRARLPGTEPAAARLVLRPAAVAADHETAAHGRGLR